MKKQQNSFSQLDKVQWQNKELEQQLAETMTLLEKQHERHKRFLVLFLNQRKVENDEQNEKIQQLTNSSRRAEKTFGDEIEKLKQENERNKNVLTTRIRQLQDEIDALVREKNDESPPTKKTTHEVTTNRPKSADLPSSPRRSLTAKVSEDILHRSKGNEHVVPTRLRPTVSNADVPTPPLARRHVAPVRPLSSSNLRGATTRKQSPEADSTFFQAAENGDVAQLVKMLKLGLNPNRPNCEGNTSLHLSSLNGHLE